MSYGSVNAQISHKKAINWSGLKVGNISKKTRRSWYQSKAEVHIWIHVKFEGRLSIPFRRKTRCKKNGTFSKRVPCPFSNSRKNENYKPYRLEFSATGLSLALQA
jgi:hypothetical protein